MVSIYLFKKIYFKKITIDLFKRKKKVFFRKRKEASDLLKRDFSLFNKIKSLFKERFLDLISIKKILKFIKKKFIKRSIYSFYFFFGMVFILLKGMFQ